MKNIKSILKSTIICLTLILIIGATIQQPASASTRSYSHHTTTSTAHRTYTKHVTNHKTSSSTHKAYKKSSTISNKHYTATTKHRTKKY